MLLKNLQHNVGYKNGRTWVLRLSFCCAKCANSPLCGQFISRKLLKLVCIFNAQEGEKIFIEVKERIICSVRSVVQHL